VLDLKQAWKDALAFGLQIALNALFTYFRLANLNLRLKKMLQPGWCNIFKRFIISLLLLLLLLYNFLPLLVKDSLWRYFILILVA
jgi:hypothetical protein